MTTFRARLVVPCETDWRSYDADSWVDAAQVCHDWHGNEASLRIEEKGAVACRWYFALVEVEGEERVVCRYHRASIARKGGVKPLRESWETRLREIAGRLGWKHDPLDLISDGWDGEDASIFEDARNRET